MTRHRQSPSRLVKPERLEQELTTLHGMLTGFGADGVVDAREMAALKAWVDEREELANSAPFKELVRAIETAMGDGVIDMEELAGILTLVERLSQGNVYYDAIAADMMRLRGILRGILTDGVINRDELEVLHQWLAEREHLRAIWPYDELESLLLEVTRDGRIDEEERQLLASFFGEFSEAAGREAGAPTTIDVVGEPLAGICAVCPEVQFEGKIFCVTGSSGRARRREFEESILELSGAFKRGMNVDIDYLVVCDEENPCWTYSCYGRKVEAAVSLRKRGHRLLIVHETDFWDAVEDARMELT